MDRTSAQARAALALLLAAGCAAGPQEQGGLRLDSDGHLRLAGGRVSVLRLSAKDKAEILARLPGDAEARRRELGLPEGLDPRSLVVEAAGGDRATALLEFLRFLASSGPPSCVNLVLRTEGGDVDVPILVRIREQMPKPGEAPPYVWGFVRGGRLAPFDEDPDPPEGFEGQSIASLRLVEADGDDQLVHAGQGGFDLLPFRGDLRRPVFLDNSPAVVVELSGWGEAGPPLEGSALRLVGPGDEARGRREAILIAEAERRGNPQWLDRGWHVIRGWKQAEEVAAGIAARPRWRNAVLRYTLVRGGETPTVASYARALRLAQRHGFKGVLVYR